MATIETQGEAFETGEKRFYMPGTVIRDTCPKCGREHERDLGQDYLSYPETNTPIKVWFSCLDDFEDEGDCEHEWAVLVVLRISLELAAATTTEAQAA